MSGPDPDLGRVHRAPQDEADDIAVVRTAFTGEEAVDGPRGTRSGNVLVYAALRFGESRTTSRSTSSTDVDRIDEAVERRVVVPALEEHPPCLVALSLVHVRRRRPVLGPRDRSVRQRQRDPPAGPHAARQLAKRVLVTALAADVLEHRDARRVVEALVGERQRATVADPKLEIRLVAGDALPLLDLSRELVDGRHPDAVPGEHDAKQLRAREVENVLAGHGAESPRAQGISRYRLGSIGTTSRTTASRRCLRRASWRRPSPRLARYGSPHPRITGSYAACRGPEPARPEVAPAVAHRTRAGPSAARRERLREVGRDGLASAEPVAQRAERRPALGDHEPVSQAVVERVGRRRASGRGRHAHVARRSPGRPGLSHPARADRSDQSVSSAYAKSDSSKSPSSTSAAAGTSIAPPHARSVTNGGVVAASRGSPYPRLAPVVAASAAGRTRPRTRPLAGSSRKTICEQRGRRIPARLERVDQRLEEARLHRRCRCSGA